MKLRFLLSLIWGIATDHGRRLGSGEMVLEVGHRELNLLEQNQIRYDEYSEQPPVLPVEPCDQEQKIALETPKNYESGPLGGFSTLSQLLRQLDKMNFLYQDLIDEREPIADYETQEGRKIYFTRITNKKKTGPKKQVLYTALHHAREPASASQMMFFMWYLLENF